MFPQLEMDLIMHYNVKISKTMKTKIYFWYLYRCFKTLESEGTITLTEIESPFFEEPHYETVFINDYPVFFDLRDDFTVDKKLDDYTKDYLLLKANFSTELWALAKQNRYPEGFEYRLRDWEIEMQPHIKAFALGRMFKIPWNSNEIKQFKPVIDTCKWKITSLCGAGILKQQTITRLHLYDLINSVFSDQTKLMFWDRNHLQTKEKQQINGYDYYLKKYPRDIESGGYKEYLQFLSQGEYSLNVAGIALSTPFRFVDSIMIGRNIITTKVWHDVYCGFPAVQLPICGYLGTGDWQQAEAILRDLNSYNKADMLNKARCWYSWNLSYLGMWKNQILNNLEGKI